MTLTPYWILNVVWLALWLLALASASISGWRYGKRHGYAEIKEAYDTLCVDHGLAVHKADILKQEYDLLQEHFTAQEQQLVEAHGTIGKLEADNRLYSEAVVNLHKEKTQLGTQVAGLQKTLKETQDELQRWQRQAVEVASPAKAPIVIPVEKTSRSSSGGRGSKKVVSE